jgi:hypothetical protein
MDREAEDRRARPSLPNLWGLAPYKFAGNHD